MTTRHCVALTLVMGLLAACTARAQEYEWRQAVSHGAINSTNGLLYLYVSNNTGTVYLDDLYIVSGDVAEQGVNRFINSGFEAGTNGWELTGDAALSQISGAYRRTGASALWLRSSGTNVGGSSHSVKQNAQGFTPGSPVTFSLWYLATTSVTFVARFSGSTHTALTLDPALPASGTGPLPQFEAFAQTCSNNALSIRWRNAPGNRPLRLLGTDDIRASNWEVQNGLTNLSSTGGEVTVSLDTTAARRFYRLSQQWTTQPPPPLYKMSTKFSIGSGTNSFVYNGQTYLVGNSEKSFVDGLKRRGMNMACFAVGWDHVEKTNGVYTFESTDGAVYYTLSQGLYCRLEPWMMRYQSDINGFVTAQDEMQDAFGNRLQSGQFMLSFASPAYTNAIRFARTVVERYKQPIIDGRMLITPISDQNGEWSYSFGYNYKKSGETNYPNGRADSSAVADYSPHFISGFRTWLSQRYTNNIAALNAAWGNSYTGFSQVWPISQPYGGWLNWNTNPPSRDWYQYRDHMMTWRLHQMLDEFATIPGLAGQKFVLADFGSTHDGIVLLRCSANVRHIVDHPLVAGVKENPDNYYPIAFEADQMTSIAYEVGKGVAALEFWTGDSGDIFWLPGAAVECVRRGSSISIMGDFSDDGSTSGQKITAMINALQAAGLWNLTNCPARPDPETNPYQFSYRAYEDMALNSGNVTGTMYDSARGTNTSAMVNVTVIDDVSTR